MTLPIRAQFRRRRLACPSLLAICAVTAFPVAAQERAAPAAPLPAATETIGFAADTVSYDDSADTVTASGNVELDRDAWRLRADQVVWSRRTGKVVASGNVALTSPQGDTAYGDSVELSDSLRDGIVENLLVVFTEGGRLAATRGERLPNGDMALERATYSPCPIVDAEGCSRNPSWQVRAARVYYDRNRNRVRYTGARIELFGVPLVPLPGLSHPVGGEAGTGFLVPDIRIDRTNGVELALPYYLRLSPNRDLTLTPHIYSNAAPMAEAELRGLSGTGAWQVRAFGTYSQRVPVTTPGATGRDDFRGHLDTSGGFQFDPRWAMSFSGRITTDRTFLRRYDISRDDRLRSTFTVARNGGSSYLTISGWAVQTLRVGERQGQQAVALPAIDFRQRLADPLLGGNILLQVNSLALTRTAGQDTQRAFAAVQWDYRTITALGQELRFTGLGRGDLYHTNSSSLTTVPSYRGEDGVQARAFASGAVDVSWPLVGRLAGGNQRITPRLQLVGTSPVDNVDIPNEDSRAFELEDGNIFSLNRFPGYDRFEDGVRATYGIDYAFDRPGLAITSSIGQSYRLDNRQQLFTDGSGLNERVSDVVGRTTVAFRSFIRLTHRFRLDKDNLAIRRNEIDATVGSRRTYATIGYARLNRDIATLGEDLRDREEVRVAARIQVARYWSVFGSAIVDLTDAEEDSTSTGDGFTAIRHRLGIAYEDDCLTVGLTWRRDYQDTGDAQAGNSFLLRLAFRNLGV